jgi:hypothetical protein
MLADVEIADIHGQFKFNFAHPAISRDDSKAFLDQAFRLDYERNGPSLYRLARTLFQQWKEYGHDHDLRVRERVSRAAASLRGGHGAALWAMERFLRDSNATLSARIREARAEMERELGGWSRAVHRSLGAVLLWTARREAGRYPAGRVLEPRTFREARG